jgi:hypothetical protein
MSHPILLLSFTLFIVFISADHGFTTNHENYTESK